MCDGRDYILPPTHKKLKMGDTLKYASRVWEEIEKEFNLGKTYIIDGKDFKRLVYEGKLDELYEQLKKQEDKEVKVNKAKAYAIFLKGFNAGLEYEDE